MSIQVEKIHLRDANDAWAPLPEWIYNQSNGDTITLGDVLEGAIGGANYYGVCETSAQTSTKIVNVQTKNGQRLKSNDLYNGLTIIVRFQNSNTASNPLLNVNDIGAFPIYRYGSTSVGTTVQASWPSNGIVSLTYDNAIASGGCWILNDANYDTDTKVTQSPSTGNTNLPLILKNSAATTAVTASTVFSTNITANPNTGNIQAASFNNIILDNAAGKGFVTTVTENSESLPTSKAVHAAIATAAAAVSAAIPNVGTAAGTNITHNNASAGTTAAGTAYAAYNHTHKITAATITSALGYSTATSAVGVTATAGTATAYARADHVHNISAATITAALGELSAEEATTGTATASKAINAKVLHGERASWYFVSGTAAATAAKGVAANDAVGYKLKTGTQIVIHFENANTVTNAAITLNIGGTGPKTIYANGAVTSDSNIFLWDANTDIEFIYDGTYYRVVSAPLEELELNTIFNNESYVPRENGTFTLTNSRDDTNFDSLTGYYIDNMAMIPFGMAVPTNASSYRFGGQEVFSIPTAYAPKTDIKIPITSLDSYSDNQGESGFLQITAEGIATLQARHAAHYWFGTITYLID